MRSQFQHNNLVKHISSLQVWNLFGMQCFLINGDLGKNSGGSSQQKLQSISEMTCVQDIIEYKSLVKIKLPISYLTH